MNGFDEGTEEVKSYVRSRMRGELPPQFVEDVMQDVNRTPQRGRGWTGWRLLAGLATVAVAITVVAVSLSAMRDNRFGSDTTPTPSVSSSPSPSSRAGESSPASSEIPYAVPEATSGPGATALEGGTYRMRGPVSSGKGWPESVVVTVPEGWSASSVVRGGGIFWSENETREHASLNFGSVGNLYADPCASWLGPVLEPPVGPAVDDLVESLRSLPGLEFSSPVDITLAGWSGKRVEVTIPADCLDDAVLWATPPEGGEVGETWRAGIRSGFHGTLWILDVDGLRFVVMASYAPDAPANVQRELELMVDSIRIAP